MKGSAPYSRLYSIDKFMRSLVVTDGGHHEIHDGHGFTAYYTVTTAATNSHRSGLYLKTPNTDFRLHMIYSVATSAAATVSICEAPTIAANIGTHTSLIYNRDRNSATTSTAVNNATAPAAGYYTTLTEAQIAADGTWATGTVLRTTPITTGSGPFAVGGSARDTQEIVLKKNTAYVLLVTNTSATATTHWLMADWYEDEAEIPG